MYQANFKVFVTVIFVLMIGACLTTAATVSLYSLNNCAQKQNISTLPATAAGVLSGYGLYSILFYPAEIVQHGKRIDTTMLDKVSVSIRESLYYKERAFFDKDFCHRTDQLLKIGIAVGVLYASYRFVSFTYRVAYALFYHDKWIPHLIHNIQQHIILLGVLCSIRSELSVLKNCRVGASLDIFDLVSACDKLIEKHISIVQKMIQYVINSVATDDLISMSNGSAVYLSALLVNMQKDIDMVHMDGVLLRADVIQGANNTSKGCLSAIITLHAACDDAMRQGELDACKNAVKQVIKEAKVIIKYHEKLLADNDGCMEHVVSLHKKTTWFKRK
jgi:hypothetical protein